MTPVPKSELVRIVEQAYSISRSDFNTTYDDNGIGTIILETDEDKHAGLALDITDAGMTAKLSLFPSINSGVSIDQDTVEEFLLDERKIDTEMINWDKFKECFEAYKNGLLVYQVPIAFGIPKKDGSDAKYKLFFDIEEKKPKVLADGSVDFKDINNIIMVDEGDILMRYYKETDGIDGKKVRGENIPAKKGKKIHIHKGNGVAFNPETGIYSAESAGHVTFKNNRLTVNPVYSVQGDVDYSEGNIEFHGTVKIGGDVLSGFEVRAKNIVVFGIARDATLIAEEDISVRTGIVSTGKGITRAGNTVSSHFIEGAEIHAGIAVIIKNYCYNSKIFCEGEILALSGDGVINGGELHAFSSIEAKKIGFERSSSFTLQVGVKYTLNDKIEKLIEQKANIRKRLEEADKTIRLIAKQNPDIKQKEQLKSIIANRKMLFEKYDGIDGEIEHLIKTSMHPMPYIMAKDEINEGIRIVIYNTEQIIPKKVKGGSKFVFNQGTGRVVMTAKDAKLEYDPKKRK